MHKQRSNGTKCLTQLYILIISEDEDDVGSNVADVAVPLQARPRSISRQVAGALGHRKESPQDKKDKKKRERGGEPLPCHHATLQSPPQSLVSRSKAESAAPSLNLRDKTQRETDMDKIHTHGDTQKHTVKNSRCRLCTAITGCSSVQVHPFGLSSAR